MQAYLWDEHWPIKMKEVKITMVDWITTAELWTGDVCKLDDAIGYWILSVNSMLSNPISSLL